ncbi:YtxH domain-containing protein [Sporolactobacillus shoreicorticis]|uniref:YtxH domain-containing protein n=1 Tax=Sporolactobacillus shoreicorticis TaxID=1923877 RepID=A0ABW5RXB4_9BACL|nr:YtxH domain-containing protein [Sporolactobacillus shoreicorticis]MCO7124880.1 YtxH domain-containing protein [Sporolactobacillus shoreicorticis]
MGQGGVGNSGKGIAFFSGLVAGGVLSGFVIYLLAAPSGKKVVRQLQHESIVLKGKSAELLQTARRKSIDLTHKISTAKSEKKEEKEQMIPIPKDY